MHPNTLDIVTLIGRVLELGLAILVDGKLAVVLHLELDFAILANEALALEEPLAVSKRVVRLYVAARHFAVIHVDVLGKVWERHLQGW